MTTPAPNDQQPPAHDDAKIRADVARRGYWTQEELDLYEQCAHCEQMTLREDVIRAWKDGPWVHPDHLDAFLAAWGDTPHYEMPGD